MKNQIVKIFVAALIATACLTAPASAQFNCIPSCAEDDARFLVISGGGAFQTLSDPVLDLTLIVPPDTTSFSIGIFDGDAVGADGAFTFHWDTGNPGVGGAPIPEYAYTVFADPNNNVSGTEVVAGPLIGTSFLGTSDFPDNDWLDIPITTGPEAQTSTGEFVYRLRIELLTEGAQSANSFKVRTSEIAVIEPIAQPFGYVAQRTTAEDEAIIYPMGFPGPTTYDGTFSFFFDADAAQGTVSVWDGDFDHGDFDGANPDTDDPTTPNAPFEPAWATEDTVPEGVAVGTGASTGAPPDDNSADPSTDVFLRQPSVSYDLITPDNQVFTNLNPSGNQEWEEFKISTIPGDPTADFVTSTLPPGPYQVLIDGVDLANFNFVLSVFRLLCVQENGDPCEPPSQSSQFLVGDTVFLDPDGNGVQDPGEPGVPGVIVNLLGESGNIIDSKVTDANGMYEFPVVPGTYIVEVAEKNLVAPAPGAALGDRVWIDDGDGLDSGEPGIANVMLRLFLDGGDGLTDGVDDTLVDITMTDADGFYLFSGLDAGTYWVDVVDFSVPSGLSLVTTAGASDPSTTRTLGPTDVVLDVDFPYNSSDALVGNYVWIDANGNGLQDSGEAGIANVTLELIDVGGDGMLGGGDDTKVAEARTGTDGSYLFAGVAPGTYVVDVTDTAGILAASGLVATAVGAGPADEDSNPDPTAPFSVAAGDAILELDFGYVNAALADITDTVWFDADRNGLFDGADTALAGVTVNLLGERGEVIASTVSDASGQFTFMDLPDGEYQLMLSDLNGVLNGLLPTTIASARNNQDVFLAGSDVFGVNFGWVDSGALQGFAGTTDDGDGDPKSHTDTVVDADVLVYDFGFRGTGSIGDRVWADANGDGDQTGENGINGVTVELLRDGMVIDSQLTSGDGNYSFENLPPGDYTVRVVPPPGSTQTFDLTGPLDNEASVSLGPGENRTDVDFGYQVPGSIGDRVWLDVDGDGVQDGGEAGINGVTVRLLDGGGVEIDSATTTGDGDYLFENLDAGAYTVIVDAGTLPPNLAQTFDLDGLLTPNTASLVLGAGEDNLDVDFGYGQCGPCLGKVSRLTLAYLGSLPSANIEVFGKRGSDVDSLFSGVVAMGEEFVVAGPASGTPGFEGTVGTEIRIFVNGSIHTVIHTSCSLPIFPGLVSGDFQVVAGASLNGGLLCPAETPPGGGSGACLGGIDFETDAMGSNLSAGQIIDDEFAGTGVTITTHDPVNHPAMIFDSANPTGADYDLGTPNQTFGGPGVGTGGASGQPGENSTPLGNVLIISEDGDSSDPDDNASGGTIIFDFAFPVRVEEVVILDIDEGQGGDIRAFDGGGSQIGLGIMSDVLGDNSVQTVSVDADGVRRLEVWFPGSGAVGGIVFCPEEDKACLPKRVRDDFDTASFSNNDGPDNWAGDWIEVDPEAGGAGPGAGQVRVLNGFLRLDDYPNTGGHPSAARQVDLSDAVSATLRFDFDTSSGVDPSDAVTVEISSDGGATYTTLEVITNIYGATWQARSFDITPFASAQTRVRFRVSSYYGGSNEYFMSNYVEIESSCGGCREKEIKDLFEVQSYSNNDGADSWAGDWIEVDPQGGGAASGQVAIHDGLLTLDDYPNTGTEPSAARQFDIAGAASATLSFEFLTSSGVDTSDAVTVEISSDGGATWTTLEVITGIHGAVTQSRSFDITAFASSETQVRFRVSSYYGGSYEVFCVSFIKIETTCPTGPEDFTLDVTKSGSGSGTVTSAPGAINCGATCSDSYTGGTMVTLTATADAGSTFAGWSGDCAGAGSATIVTVDANKTCNAQFDLEPSVDCPCDTNTNWANPFLGTVWGNFAGGLFNGPDTTCTNNNGASVTLLIESPADGSITGAGVTGGLCEIYNGSATTPALTLPVTAAEAAACRTILQTAAAGEGVACSPDP